MQNIPMNQALGKVCPIMSSQHNIMCKGAACMWWHRGKTMHPKVIPHSGNLVEQPARPHWVPLSFNWMPFDEAEGDGSLWIEPLDELDARQLGSCGAIG